MKEAAANPINKVVRLLLSATRSSPLAAIVNPAFTMAVGNDMNNGLTWRPNISQVPNTVTIDAILTSQARLLFMRPPAGALESTTRSRGGCPGTADRSAAPRVPGADVPTVHRLFAECGPVSRRARSPGR